MKVDAVKNISYNTRMYNKSISKDTQQVIQNYSPVLQLPNYESVSSKLPLNVISFSGNFINTDDINQEYIKQVETAEKELEALRSKGENKAVNKAIEENEFYDDFEENNYSYYIDAVNAAYEAIETWKKDNSRWYRIWHSGEKMDIRAEEMKSYYAKERRYMNIKPRYETNKALIENSQANEEQKAKRIEELEALIDRSKKLIDYAGLRKTINDALAGHGGLNERIAGYNSVRNQIRKFIESLSTSKENEEAYVSPCVILYGATGTGKTTFLHAIENMASDDVEIVRFNNDESISFMKRFRDACREAKQRYRDTNKRTILLMDDAEKYFCMPIAEAKAYYKDELDESDMGKLEIIEKNGSNDHVKEFKSILDVISQVPEEEDDDPYKSAMSIFITTNHPHLIDRQLIKRPEKMDAYHVGPAKGEDLKAVVEFYFKDKEKIIENLKMFKDRPDMEAAIDCLANLDIDAKNSIKEYFKADKADMLNIDPSEVDYDVLTEDIQPSKEKGAYSNVMIKHIAFKAFERYLQNPENSYQAYFYEELERTARDIEPQRYKRYLDTADFVNLYKQSEQINNTEDKYEFVKLLDKRNKKLIGKTDAASLEKFLQQMTVRIEALKEKQESGTISENECAELETLLEQDKLSKDPQMVKEYLRAHKK